MKAKKEVTTEITLSKKEFQELLRETFDLKGEIHYSFKEEGDHDRGTYEVTDVTIWSIELK